MCSLVQIRDQLALYGQTNASQLSQRLAAPEPLVQAMLDALVRMQKIERLNETPPLTDGRCKGCLQKKSCQSPVSYRLVKS